MTSAKDKVRHTNCLSSMKLVDFSLLWLVFALGRTDQVHSKFFCLKKRRCCFGNLEQSD